MKKYPKSVVHKTNMEEDLEVNPHKRIYWEEKKQDEWGHNSSQRSARGELFATPLHHYVE